MKALYNKLNEQAELRHFTLKWVKLSKKFIFNVFMTVVLLGICYVILSPIIGIVSKSVMPLKDLFNPLIFLIPENFTLDNFVYATKYMDYITTLIQTMGYSLGMAILNVAVASMVGYGFARFRKLPGAGILFALLIITIVVPLQAYMVPLFIQFRFFNFFGNELNLIGSYASMIILTATGVGLRSGLYIYIFRQFFKGIPKELEEAAYIDGAGRLKTYLRIMLPNAKPAIITVFLFSFVWHYNDTSYSSLLMPGKKLMSVMLTTLSGNFSVTEHIHDPNRIQLVVFSGILLGIIPILIIYLLMQRQFIEGVERSGIVG